VRSIYGQSKSIEDTERVLKGVLPLKEGEEKAYRVAYAVHEILDSTKDSQAPAADEASKIPTKFIGFIKLASLNAFSLPLPEELTVPAADAATTLSAELAYEFLPQAWGRGFATEALEAFFDACKRSTNFWAPYERVYMRAIVNEENPASLKVMSKVGMKDKGVYVWTGRPVWLAGKWTERSDLHICGKYLLE
jgi:RimJ/RimL family protein N-acetyltransferase